MAFDWHDHHFINGIACLDFANTVVYRNRPERREDRLRSAADVKAWGTKAGLARPRSLSLDDAIGLREAIDRVFRGLAEDRACPPIAWKQLVSLYMRELAGAGLELGTGGGRPSAQGVLLSIAHSAMTLALSPEVGRVKMCGGCGWLFVDRTRNGNKRWCSSGVCGSRDKARRYYARKRLTRSFESAGERGLLYRP